jgi:hypothetical protein
MTAKTFLLTSLTAIASICRAQDGSPALNGPGTYPAAVPGPGQPPVSGIHPLVSNPPYPGGTTAIAEAVTPDIAALARNLNNDPTAIFNYVHDQIRYTHYFGSHKGAEITLLERSGNDFDQ